MKLAIVLFNLGGPDSPEAVEPFLRNLFSDPAIIALPGIFRWPLARLIARRRAVRAFQEARFGPIFLERGPEEVGELSEEIPTPTPLPSREGAGG